MKTVVEAADAVAIVVPTADLWAVYPVGRSPEGIFEIARPKFHRGTPDAAARAAQPTWTVEIVRPTLADEPLRPHRPRGPFGLRACAAG